MGSTGGRRGSVRKDRTRGTYSVVVDIAPVGEVARRQLCRRGFRTEREAQRELTSNSTPRGSRDSTRCPCLASRLCTPADRGCCGALHLVTLPRHDADGVIAGGAAEAGRAGQPERGGRAEAATVRARHDAERRAVRRGPRMKRRSGRTRHAGRQRGRAGRRARAGFATRTRHRESQAAVHRPAWPGR